MGYALVVHRYIEDTQGQEAAKRVAASGSLYANALLEHGHVIAAFFEAKMSEFFDI